MHANERDSGNEVVGGTSNLGRCFGTTAEVVPSSFHTTQMAENNGCHHFRAKLRNPMNLHPLGPGGRLSGSFHSVGCPKPRSLLQRLRLVAQSGCPGGVGSVLLRICRASALMPPPRWTFDCMVDMFRIYKTIRQFAFRLLSQQPDTFRRRIHL